MLGLIGKPGNPGTLTQGRPEVTAIETKGKIPGGSLSKSEVEDWITKLPIIRGHLRAHPSLREAKQTFEIWTSGTIEPDALALLQDAKAKWSKSEIGWKDGKDVLAIAKAGKEKAITDALYQHFISHPLADVNFEVGKSAPIAIPSVLSQGKQLVSISTAPIPIKTELS